MSHRVLGIDPGYDRCGVAVVERNNKKTDVILYSFCITTPKGDPAHRLYLVQKTVKKILSKYTPDSMALEKIFFNKNQKTALRVAEVRGVLLAASSEAKISVHEYSPQEIKLAITGYGASSKTQIADMVQKLVSVRPDIKYDDEFDAIATALTHLSTNSSILSHI